MFSINALFSTLDDVVIEGTTDIFQLPKTYCKLFVNLFLKKFYLFMYGYAESSCFSRRLSVAVVSEGYSLIAVHGFLIAVASPIVGHGLQGAGASGVAALGV